MPSASKTRHEPSQTTPRASAASPALCSHSTLRTAPSATTATSTSSTSPSESRAWRSRPCPSPSNAMTVTWQRRSTPYSRWNRAATVPAAPPSAPESGVGARSVSVTESPSSRQLEATSEPVNPPPMTSTRRGQPSAQARRVVLRPQRAHPVEGGGDWVGPWAGTGTRGDQDTVEADPPPVGEQHLPTLQVQPRG